MKINVLDFIFYYFNISRLQDFYKHRKKRCVIILLQDFNKLSLLLPKHPYKTLLLFYYIFILLYLDIFINEKGMCFIKWKRKCVGAKKKREPVRVLLRDSYGISIISALPSSLDIWMISIGFVLSSARTV